MNYMFLDSGEILSYVRVTSDMQLYVPKHMGKKSYDSLD